MKIFLLYFVLLNGYFVHDVFAVDNSTLTELYEYVVEYITNATTYVLPTDNSDSTATNSTGANDFGTFDFIIVGGGTAGTLMANRLSQISSWKILLLEAGNETENAFTDIPALNYYLRNTSMNWGYYTKAQNNSCLGMIDHKCVYPTGKVLRGSAVLGDMVLARGNRQDFDNWANMGNEGWSYEDLLPYFKKIEQIEIENYDYGFHGHDGEMKINYTSPTAINSDVIFKAAMRLGLRQIDYNGENQIGISKVQWTIDFNKRLTGSTAFVLPILENRTNLNVTLGAFVTKVLVNGTTATGVQFVCNGTTYNAIASKEVILSAGAINSPQILMLSGIGPKEKLESLNITVTNDLPVGKYLTDHPGFVGLYIRTNQTAESRTVKENIERYLEGLTPLTSVFAAEHIAFLNTKNNLSTVSNCEIITINAPSSVPGDPKMFYHLNSTYQELFSTFDTYTDMTVYVINIKPKSRGSITLASNDPVDFPIIDPAYYTDSNDEDIEVVNEGIQFVLKLLETPEMRSINATLIFSDSICSEYTNSTSSREYWHCAIKHFTSTLYHPTGTTKMGTAPENSVVNSTLVVHNMSNLRVVDAGCIPEIVSGHPIAAIWAMAEKISDVIKDVYDVAAV